jgi:hypothetical protein
MHCRRMATDAANAHTISGPTKLLGVSGETDEPSFVPELELVDVDATVAAAPPLDEPLFPPTAASCRPLLPALLPLGKRDERLAMAVAGCTPELAKRERNSGQTTSKYGASKWK